MQEEESIIFRVVLTGGPCAGKTSSLSFISDYFGSLGWTVYIVRETANILLSGGVSFAELNEDQVFCFQKSIFKVITCIEDTYLDLAKHARKGQKTLILCDRGLMDGSVYCDRSYWERILKDMGFTEFEARDKRYDFVVHLVTAAIGAERFYTLETSTVRKETIEEARVKDANTLHAWMGHPSVVCIDNSTPFKEKVLRALRAICSKAGVLEPSMSISKRKFLVTEIGEWNLRYFDSRCEYTFIESKEENTQQRIRKRGQNRQFVYTQTLRIHTPAGKVERKRNLSWREFSNLKTHSIPNHDTVKLIKRTFMYESTVFELSFYEHPSHLKGLKLLETYADPDVTLKFPTEIISIDKEVTDDRMYSMYTLSESKTPTANNNNYSASPKVSSSKLRKS